MTKTKKVLSVMMAALMLVFTCMTYVPASAAEVTANAPEVAFVGIDHSPLVVGDTESFSFTTNNADKVQYNVVINDAAGKLVEDVTKGYAAETAGNVPFELKATTVFAAGKYSLVVNAKRVSDGKIATYTAALNCVSKDDANRVYANGAMVTDKDSYVIGDKITVTGINGLAGIPGPYKYRLHVFNATTGTWTKNVVANYGDKIEWTPSAPGTYVLDVHVNTEKSTTWAKYAANPTSTDVYGTYEAWKLKTVVVSDTLKVTNVTSVNKKSVKVTFNKDVKDVKAANFEISEKDDQYALSAIDSVSADKNVVTLTLIDELSADTQYVLATKNVKDSTGNLTLTSATNEFKYVEVTDAASIAFVKTTVSASTADTAKTLNVVIKDKDGNDITANIVDLDDPADITDKLEVETSNTAIVDTDLTVGILADTTVSQKAIVNVKIADTTVETGNTIITVQNALTKLASVGRATLVDGAATAPDYKSPTTSLYESTATYYAKFEALDADAEEIADGTVVDGDTLTKTFRSLNPTILVVDATSGLLKPVAKGTATVVMTATLGDNKYSKTMSVEVKADKEETSLKLDKTTVTLVRNSNVTTNVTATVLDQYSKVMKGLTTVTYKINYDNIVDLLVKDTETVLAANVDGEYVIPLLPVQDADATAPKTAKITVEYKTVDADGNTQVDLKGYVTVTLVKSATFVGYAVTADDTKLDLIDTTAADVPNHDTNADLQQGPDATTIHVYEKDTNGNYINELDAADFTTELATASKHYVSTDGNAAITATKVGSEAVTVKVGTATVGKVTFTVVDSTPVVDTLDQLKSVLTMNYSAADATWNDVWTALFGSDADGAAFVGYSQYDKKIAITTDDVDVVSSDDAVVTVAGGVITAVGNGTATLTIVGDKVYTITVNVKNMPD